MLATVHQFDTCGKTKKRNKVTMKKNMLLGLLTLAFTISSTVFAEEPKKEETKKESCCDKAKKDGKECTHPCCVKAKKEGKVCEKCN